MGGLGISNIVERMPSKRAMSKGIRPTAHQSHMTMAGWRSGSKADGGANEPAFLDLRGGVRDSNRTKIALGESGNMLLRAHARLAGRGSLLGESPASSGNSANDD